MSEDFNPESVPIRPAATVIPLRDGIGGLEVLVLRRDSRLVFHANSWVFPGGRVDDDEIAAARGDELASASAAAVREAHEEAGLRLEPGNLVELSHWTTPIGPRRRFATWFFVVAAPGDEVVIDDGEIRGFEWYQIDHAVAACEAGEIQLAAPTYISLLCLRPYATVEAALAWVRGRANDVYKPRIYRDGERLFSVYQDDPAYESGDLSVPGSRHRHRILEVGYEYVNERDPPV